MEQNSRIKMSEEGVTCEMDIIIAKEQDFFIAHLPQLNLTTFSKESEKKALSELDNAIKLFFDVYNTKETLSKKLEALGWVKYSDQQKFEPTEIISVPYNLLSSNPSQRKHQVNLPTYANC